MRRLFLPLLSLAAACQSESRRLLLVDLTLADPLAVEAAAAPWHDVGYRVEYRQYYPHLTRQDLARYRALVLLGGREPGGVSDALTIGDLAILNEWVRRDGVVILGYAEGSLDRWIMNQWLAAQGAGIAIGTEQLDSPALPLPHSALDNAGFAPFPAGRNRPLRVRDRSQTLARSSGGPLVAASRVGDGLIIVASKRLLAASDDDARTREFLVALARWTRRPAEWAGVGAASGEEPLRLASAPQPVTVHPPPLAPPAGAAATVLPQPVARTPTDTVVPPSWIARQGMRVLWSRFTPQSFDELLEFVDVAALNALATVIPVPALTDTLGTRNIWRATAERLQATSVRWFPGVSLLAIPSQGVGEGTPRRSRRFATTAEAGTRGSDEVDRRGELVPIACGLDSVFWRGGLRPTFRTLARLGGARPDVITGVALDLDGAMTHFAGSGFCDADYRVGLSALGLARDEVERLAALPPALRYDTLLEHGWLSRYFEALQGAVAERAIALRGELRRLHPDLRFAFHADVPPDDWFSLGLLRGFSSADAPVFLWLGERRTHALLRRRYHERGIYALAAVRLEPAEPPVRTVVFDENDGFWLNGAVTDSLGRMIRRFVR